MSYWVREVAGWLLVLVGLWLFWQSYDMLLRKRVFEAVPTVFMGFIVFRGGVHLLKIAVAARVARSLPEVQTAAAPVRRTPRLPVRQVGPTAPETVLPGPKTSGRPKAAAGRPGERGA